MKSLRLTFPNARGDELSARLDLPVDGAPVAHALFAHCFTCSKDLRAVRNISLALTEAKLAVLRFDFTGLGESEGDFADTGIPSNVADLVCAARHLAEAHHAPQLLIGHSLGGAAALLAAHELPSVRAVATIAAPSEPSHVAKLLGSSREEIRRRGEADVVLAGRRFKLRREFLDGLEQPNMVDAIENLRRALLILHSPLDTTVGIDNAAAIFEAAKHPKSFVSLDQADHLLSDEGDSHYVGATIAAWARRYIEVERQPSWLDDVSDNRVAVRTGRGLRTEMMANGFSLVADEPERLGGTNSAPTPYDYLAAALGACTSMTLRLYADRKSWPLEGAVVTVRHRKVHAEDCADCDKPGAKLDLFERELLLEGDLDDSQRGRLLEIAERCPVHRTLTSTIQIRTRLRS